MPTKLFLRNTLTNGVSVSGNIYYDMLETAGAALDTDLVDTVASGTEIQWTQNQAADVEIQWISGYVPAGGFTLTNTDISAWLRESGAAANCGGRYRVFKRSLGGTETEVGGGPFDNGVELNSIALTETAWSGDVTDTFFEENSRLVMKLYITNIGTMGTLQSCTIGFNAADGSTGDSFFNIAETVNFQTEPVSSAIQGGGGYVHDVPYATTRESRKRAYEQALEREYRLKNPELEVIAEVAEKEADKEEADRMLREEMALRKLEFDARYLNALADYRGFLRDAEIAQLMRMKQDDDDAIALCLTAAIH